MSKINPIAQFIIVTLVLLGVTFFVHTTILQSNGLPKYDNLIIKSYLVNGVLAALIYVLLFSFRKKLKNQIGFLFIAGSFLKFIVFFIVFYPVYKVDSEMSRLEFAAFFAPYAISLIIETIFMSKMLKKLE
ncbi:MAG: hypothetical protein COA50_04400 [Flavobacteriaceae bacterium]|nr:MAG: hypothetical protein COA50_04400 [Flavobacteriaceae bacterium]